MSDRKTQLEDLALRLGDLDLDDKVQSVTVILDSQAQTPKPLDSVDSAVIREMRDAAQECVDMATETFEALGLDEDDDS